jgi:hypothetical protein
MRLHPALVIALILGLCGVALLIHNIRDLAGETGIPFYVGIVFAVALGIGVLGFLAVVLLGFVSKARAALVEVSEAGLKIVFEERRSSVWVSRADIRAVTIKEVKNKGIDQDSMHWSEVTITRNDLSPVKFIIPEADEDSATTIRNWCQAGGVAVQTV